MGRGKHKQKKRKRRQKLASKGVYSGQASRCGVLRKEIREEQRGNESKMLRLPG